MTHFNPRITRPLSAASLLLVASAALLGAKSCGGPKPTPPPQCTVPKDCAGLPHVDCEGAWSCSETAQCEWSCGAPGTIGCASNTECGEGLVCSVECPVCITTPCPCIGSCVKPTLPPIPEPYTCMTDADCGLGFCAIDYCTKIACQPGLPCPICYGTCKDQPPVCEFDEDCAPGQSCVLGPCPLAPCVFDPATGEAICPKCYGTCENDPTPTCMKTGCSGQICANHDVFSICDWKPEYACYASAICEAQPSGECGFTPTADLLECLGGEGE